MKAGWEIKTLGEVCLFENGDRGENYPSKAIQTTTGVPFINAGHLTDDGIGFEKMSYIPRERFNLLGNGKIRKNDILFCLRGSLGKFASVGELSEGAIASSLVIIRPKELVLNEFVLAYFQSDLCAKMIDDFKNGAAQPNLSAGSLKNFTIPIPSLPEQKRLVTLLDEAFESIATAKANAQQNLKNARALFESHLNEVFTKRGEGWEEKTLADVVDAECSLSYGIVQPGDEFPNGLPVIRPTNLTSKFIHIDELKLIDPKLADSYKRTTLIGNELLLCVRGSTGVVSIASKELKGANVTRGIVPIRFNPEILIQEFGYYLIISDCIQQQIREKTYGAALMQINIGDLRKILVTFPTLNHQRIMVQKLDTLSEETQRLVALYSRKIAALDELKKALLHRAFSGEL